MKCVILAAGTSSRLSLLTASTPKCLLEVGKSTILERLIQNVLRESITDFVIVTGFQAEKIHSFIRASFPSLTVQFIHNERFAETNNGYSLTLASSAFQGEDILLLDSDILFDRRILHRLLTQPFENCLAVRTKGRFDDEEIKVVVDQRGQILKIGRMETVQSFLGESIGIARFSRHSTLQLSEILRRRVLKDGNKNELYEVSFQELIDTGTSIHAVDMGDYACIEIDTPEDLRIARETIAPQLDPKHSSNEERGEG